VNIKQNIIQGKLIASIQCGVYPEGQRGMQNHK